MSMSGLGPNGLLFVGKGRVRKLFPLRSASVSSHDPAFSIGSHDDPALGYDLAALFADHIEGMIIYLRVGTHIRIGIACYFVIFAVESSFPLHVDRLSVCIDAVTRHRHLVAD